MVYFHLSHQEDVYKNEFKGAIFVVFLGPRSEILPINLVHDANTTESGPNAATTYSTLMLFVCEVARFLCSISILVSETERQTRECEMNRNCQQWHTIEGICLNLRHQLREETDDSVAGDL